MAGTISVIVAVIAGVVALTAAAPARRWLGFGFDGVPHQVGQAAGIMFANLRFVLGLGAAAALNQLAQLRRRGAPAASTTTMLSAIARGLDGVVAVVILINVVPIGLALGAYGWRMVPALLPHGPFEVLAFCVAGNLFLNARRRTVARGEWCAAGTAIVALLSLAALLETFAWFG